MVERKAFNATSKATPTWEILKSTDINLKELVRNSDLSSTKRTVRLTPTVSQDEDYTDRPIYDDFNDGKWMGIG